MAWFAVFEHEESFDTHDAYRAAPLYRVEADYEDEAVAIVHSLDISGLLVVNNNTEEDVYFLEREYPSYVIYKMADGVVLPMYIGGGEDAGSTD